MSDKYEFEYDGWKAFTDHSESSVEDLQEEIIDRFIHLAAKTGNTVLDELEGCLWGAKMSGIMGGSEVPLDD